MGNSRKFTTKFNATSDKLRAALKAQGITTAGKKRIAVANAASGRIDMSDKARLRLAASRAMQGRGE